MCLGIKITQKDNRRGYFFLMMKKVIKKISCDYDRIYVSGFLSFYEATVVSLESSYFTILFPLRGASLLFSYDEKSNNLLPINS